MVYLLNEWFVDPDNENRVRELIAEMKSDIKDSNQREEEEIIQEIESMGETTIAELLRQDKI